MRIIKEKTLYVTCQNNRYEQANDSIKSWIQEVRSASWEGASDLKRTYGNASIITAKRVVFNIKGNHFRLIVDIEYKLKLVFVVWFGSHKEYDKIDSKLISYEK